MLCPKWKPYRDAMPTAASQAAPCQTSSEESCAAAKGSRAMYSRPIILQSWAIWPSRDVSPKDGKRVRDGSINYRLSPSAVQSLCSRIQTTSSLPNFVTSY
ncbi:hypothetical protein M441DRAFT_72114 [Trichoderma asperellum CBS 433.97]|uniref:Uncharacterized protein n=1 Tax=Trichoderma asperellum (strain ATCC 204424 / CBS 433.97 / NBRC 101777) TaxID=1042311 RepID=A0A2T3YYP6_TRIA4|nr:hypothetical protein M441DRAFT_72114 [Trichoderma asperellum CBS 433.97]PTB37685.1 hypothetical protein M441DRAFT_72114 [Trichoderma asperellum CBS 433.97]